MYSDFAPLAGIVSASEERMFKLLSLREGRFLHILRFCSTIHDFKSSTSHIVFSLSEGMLKVYNVASFEQLYSLSTLHINDPVARNTSTDFYIPC